MSPLSILVLTSLAVSTIVLTLYVWLLLPKRVDDEIRGSLRVFSTAIELRFPSYQGLTDRVVSLSRATGQQLGLSTHQLADLESAAHLRDIGLCAVPYRMGNEVAAMNWSEAGLDLNDRHAEISGAMLESIPSLRRFAPIVRCHHLPCSLLEDGSFIPLASVPIESRILNVVTTYTWAERHQGDLIARESLRSGRGAAFDPEVVDAFLAVLTSGRAREASSVAPVC